MKEKNHLYILWTNADIITSEKMVFMYAINAMLHGWWKNVTLVIWGATAKLSAENDNIKGLIKNAQEAGVHVAACKACAEHLGVAETLEQMNIEVKYWGLSLTEILQSDEKLLTV